MILAQKAYFFFFMFCIFVFTAGFVQGAPANLVVAGKKVVLSPKPEYESGKVTAPVTLLQSLGVQYYQSKTPGHISVVLPDKNTADIKTTSRSNTLFIDIQEVAKVLGIQMKWTSVDSTCRLTPIINSVTHNNGTVVFSTGLAVPYTVTKWSGKLIIDVANAEISPELLKSGAQRVDTDHIEQIRTGMYNKTTARIVLDLIGDPSYAVLSSKVDSRIAVKVGSTGEVSAKQNTDTAAVPPVVVGAAELLDVDGVSFDISINVSSKVIVGNSADTKSGVIRINIPNAQLAEDFVAPTFKHPALKYIKFTQVTSSPPKINIDIALTRIMRVDPVSYQGTIAVSVRPYYQSSGSIAEKIFVVDPGHGGNQPGAIGGSVKEKDLNLAISRKLAAALRKTGATVILTRETDVAVDLGDRSQIAIDNGSHFFISIHCNSNSIPNSVSGSETYYHGWNPSSIYLAKHIQSAMCEATEMKDRGARSDRRDTTMSGFKVLRLLDTTQIPAVLVEAGYLNHSGDRTKLLDPLFQNKLVDGIVDGIKSYIAGEYTK